MLPQLLVGLSGTLGLLLGNLVSAAPATASPTVTRPSVGVDAPALYRAHQRCSTYTVFEPALPSNYRLVGGLARGCRDSSVGAGLRADYDSPRGSLSIYEAAAGSSDIQRAVVPFGWRRQTATVQLATGTAKVFANCGYKVKRCKVGDITRYGGGLQFTLPGEGGLADTDVLMVLSDRFAGKPTIGLAGLVDLASRLQPTTRPSADVFGFYIKDSAGNPARWNRCAPIRYAINASSVPSSKPAAVETIRAAIREISSASGYTFQEIGDTAVVPNTGEPETWMTDQADLFIGFADPALVTRLTGPVAGTTQHRLAYGPDGALRITGAGIAIDSTEDIASGFSTRGLGPIVLHELGHVLNLDHVSDPEQLMSPVLNDDSPSHLQPGDLAGLAQLGVQAC